jgi:hypothetical protein
MSFKPSMGFKPTMGFKPLIHPIAGIGGMENAGMIFGNNGKGY